MCLPYKDGRVIASQVMAIVAFGISLWASWWVSLVISFIGMVLLQILWCCRQNKHSIYASAAIASIASFSSLFAGIFALAHWKDKTFCDMLVLGNGKL